jgi:hypothetical protein
MTATRHPVHVEFDAIEAMFAEAAIRKDIEWLEQRSAFLAAMRGSGPISDAEAVDAIVIRALRSAADKLDRACYGDPALAAGDHYAGMPA